MAAGPPPNMIVSARYVFAKRFNSSGGLSSFALATSKAINDTASSLSACATYAMQSAL